MVARDVKERIEKYLNDSNYKNCWERLNEMNAKIKEMSQHGLDSSDSPYVQKVLNSLMNELNEMEKQKKNEKDILPQPKQEFNHERINRKIDDNMISNDLLTEIISFLTPLSCFQDEKKRQALMIDAGLGDIIPFIDFKGASNVFVANLIDQFNRDGKRQDLITCLEKIKEPLGEDKKEKIDNFIQQLQLQLQNTKKFTQNEIEFVNRTKEIGKITSFYGSPLLLISAPAGYGKSWLLKAVIKKLKRKKWKCLSLLLKKGQHTIRAFAENVFKKLHQIPPRDLANMTPQQSGEAVAQAILQAIRQPQKVALLIDNAESLNERNINDFLDIFIPALQDELQKNGGVKLRLICAGRYIASWNKNQAEKTPVGINVMPLTPFDFEAVYETVENYAQKKGIPSSEDFAVYLMSKTGGHPKAMVDLLKEVFGLSFNFIRQNNDHYYDRFINPVLGEIRDNLSQELVDLFKTLSVFRRYNNKLLSKMIEKKIISYAGKAGDLQKQLGETYLVHLQGEFLVDDIVRRLFAIQLRMEVGDETFAQRCLEAKELYNNYLRETNTSVHIVAIEALYQELQYAYYRGEEIGFFGENGILATYLTILLEKPESERNLFALKDVLQDGQDWEFRFTVNFFLRQEHYTDGPYQRLIEEVSNFIKTACPQRGQDHV